MLDKKVVQTIIESDSPELIGLLQEFRDVLDQSSNQLKPVLEKARAKQIPSTQAGISYLEMKYNLQMSYCTFLAFYLLLKVEGKAVEGHPVVHRLAHIKTLFEKLRPLDAKLQYQVDKMIRLSEEQSAGAKIRKQDEHLKYKPNIDDLKEMGSDDDASGDDMEGSYGDEEDGESSVEEDMGPAKGK